MAARRGEQTARMAYGDDLAYIHHSGFSGFAGSAAPAIIDLLRLHAARRVVELGCGSGVLAGALAEAGFEVFGFDPSPAMVALARLTAPAVQFAVGALHEAETAECDAVVAIGEVLNHVAVGDVRAFVERVEAPLLVFDIAEAEAYPAHDEERVDGDDWSVIVLTHRDGNTVSRQVRTFVAGEETMRRGEEVHHLQLYTRTEMTALLEGAGYRVTRRSSYGTTALPDSHAVYIAERG